MLYIGVDLGTSAVKLLLMDEKGGIKKIVSKEYDLYFPHPGWSEQKPEDWYTQSMEGIKELISECDKSQVSGISFGGQMHGLVVLDENDNVIRPAILWNDGRTQKQTNYPNTQPILLSQDLQHQKSCGCVKMNQTILIRSKRSCCQKTIWHINYLEHFVRTIRMHQECYC